MKLNIAVLPGDGIGPEISVQGVEVMSAVCEKFGHEVHYEYALCGADAIDKVGDPFPEETYRICKDADAVLFSAVGDPKFDNDPTAKVRPEQGLLAMRKKLACSLISVRCRPSSALAQVAAPCGTGGRCGLHLHPRTDGRYVFRREVSGQRQGLRHQYVHPSGD